VSLDTSAGADARPRALVAGIGNVFLGDDGFGVEVARRLAGERVPDWAEVADIGIAGVHLAYELLDGYELTILVDATPRGGAPGSVYVIEPSPGPAAAPGSPPGARGGFSPMDAHGMDPETVLALVGTLGGTLGKVLVVGCEPAEVTDRMGLSAPVAAAVGPAVDLVKELLADFGRAGPGATPGKEG
jgi:hydrogenase maturation protease